MRYVRGCLGCLRELDDGYLFLCGDCTVSYWQHELSVAENKEKIDEASQAVSPWLEAFVHKDGKLHS